MVLSVGIAHGADPAADDSIYVSQVSTATTGDLAPDAQIVGVGQPITVAEAVSFAIRNSLDVEVERFAPMVARSNAEEAWGAYDPFLRGNFGYRVDKSPNTFALNSAAGNRERFKGGGVGFDQAIPLLGATLSVDYNASSTATRNTIQSFDEQFNSRVFFKAKVPLARGLIWNADWTNVKLF